MKMKVTGFALAILFLVCICERLRIAYSTSTPCALRSSEYGSVCVCNVTYCDFMEPVSPIGDDGFVITSSSKAGLRFASTLGQFADKDITIKDWIDPTNETNTKMVQRENKKVTINIDRSKKYQTIVGFGGGFTGAVSYLLKNLPQELQDSIYKSYFSKKGIRYNMIRVPIGGSDFDLAPWAYNELPEDDTNLSNFTKLSDLDEQKITQMERLKSVAGIKEIKIIGTAWSPPKWMKTKKSWTGLSFLQKKYYQTWADYHLRFLELMAAKNFPLWGITTGNEPLNGVIGWMVIHFMSLGWTPSQQAVWVADNLGPTIRNSKFKDIKIFSNDEQRFSFAFWFDVMNATRKESVDYLDGLGVHWYLDNWSPISVIDNVHNRMPEKLLFNTESCVGGNPGKQNRPMLGSWSDAESYATSYLENLQHSFNGYLDWNMILNEDGGPTYINNLVGSPVIVNATSGQEIYKQPLFYTIGHFSRFIPEGSMRIDAESSNKNIVTVAFERPDGTIACVFFNSAQAEAVVTLAESVRGNMNITIPGKSLHTIEYK